jgi:predicted ATP-dependent endonuclease of OLD family
MTIEEILNCNISELEKMSDDELREHFKPYLSVTQPDPNIATTKPKRKIKATTISKKKKQTLKQQMEELAKLHGVKLDKSAKDILPKNLQ